MQELKRCPFCDGSAELVKISTSYNTGRGALTDGFKVECSQCKTETNSYYSCVFIADTGEVVIEKNGAEKAIEAWNLRV